MGHALLLQEAGSTQSSILQAKTDLAEFLFKLATLNKEEWGYMLGTCNASARGRSNAVEQIAVVNQLMEAATVGDP